MTRPSRPGEGGAARPVDVHVAPAGNAFMVDIASWLVEASRIAGRDARLLADGSLPGDDRGRGALSLVVAPHEFYELSSRSRRELVEAANRSVPVATEQPGTSWFDVSTSWCRQAPLALDINAIGTEALVAEGVEARWLRLGGVPSMDRRAGGGRPVDVTVLAGLTEHRARRLAGLAPGLWRRRCELRLFPTDRPVADTSSGDDARPGTGPLFGVAKYDLLASSRVLLNLHRDGGRAYLEWARVVEAMANGCAVVTEPSDRIEPLVDGEHLIVTDDVGAALDELLADPERLDRIGAAAADLVHGDLALARTLGPMLDDVDGATPASPSPSVVRPGLARRALGAARSRSSSVGPHGRSTFRPHARLRNDLLDAVVAERALRREIDAARCRHAHGGERVVTHHGPAWAGFDADGRDGAPAVSAIVTLFDYGDVVTDALDSLAASTDVSLEIVVVDDHSTDDGRAVVRRWIDEHPDLAVLLVGLEANGGLASARNRAIESTRTDRVMVLDADNAVYPTCLRRLADALDADAGAALAWSILEVFGDEPGLLSAFAWDPDRLRARNVVDAQVMLRRSVWSELGGYRELAGMLPGWEDWDLWLRLVESGRRGVLVPEILGRYRSQPSSMVSGPNRFGDVMLERFRRLHPSVTSRP